MKYCTSCKKKIPDNSSFCPFCGKKFGIEDAMAQATWSMIDDDIAQLQAEIGIPNVVERITAIIKTGKGESDEWVNSQFQKEVRELSQAFERLAPTETFAKMFKEQIHSLNIACQAKETITSAFRKRWEDAIKTSSPEILKEDFLVLNGGLKELLLQSPLIDKATLAHIVVFPGVVRGTELLLLTYLLLCLKAFNIVVKSDGKQHLIEQYGEEFVDILFKNITDYENLKR